MLAACCNTPIGCKSAPRTTSFTQVGSAKTSRINSGGPRERR